MKHILLVTALTLKTILLFSQAENKGVVKMVIEHSSDNEEIEDILHFEEIEYLKLLFSGKDLADKSYHLTVKEIWNGEIKSDSTILNSKRIPFEQFQTINDTVLKLRVISKHTSDNELKISFRFPRFSVTKKFDAIKSDDYSLRNIAEANDTEINYGEKFYLLAYILPYEKDGVKYYCAVEGSGNDIKNWGKEFGIRHYLVFEMKFE